MQLSQITIISFFGLILAKPLQQKRTVSDIEGAVDTLSSELTGFDDAINSFADSVTDDQAQDFLASYISLQASISKATSDVKSTGSLSKSDFNTIQSAVDDLTTQVVDTLTDAHHKLSSVESAGYVNQVCDGLSTFNDESDGFYEALLSIIDSTFATHVTDLQTTADKSFTSTMKSYGC